MSARNKQTNGRQKENTVPQQMQRDSGKRSVGSASNGVQHEVNSHINEIVAEVLETYNAPVKAAQARHLV